ncbi:hypothetical protein L6164_012172 [Bauhinia variegata]|uniref:Uncharacterized protein n=1 Tax=Bauhinia variegata TaxID=167791 RepID=A0ACB9PAF6_BAUVA|nr:hypothetical protein L6164_012172 [Bauhinia variegata]
MEASVPLDEMIYYPLQKGNWSTLAVSRELDEEWEKEEQLLQAQTQALQASTKPSVLNKGKGTWKGKGNKEAEGNQKGWSGEKQKEATSKWKSKAHIECFRCHKFGHYKSECRTNLRRGEKSNYAEQQEKEAEISLLMVYHAGEENTKNIWYLDSGCSNHMSGDKETFAELDETFNDIVKFGDHSTVEVRGRDKVSIQTKSGHVQSILNVLYVPNLKTNLLSIGQLQEKGYEIVIKNGVCQVKDDELGLILQAKMTSNRMFPIYLQNSKLNCLVVEKNNLA